MRSHFQGGSGCGPEPYTGHGRGISMKQATVRKLVSAVLLLFFVIIFSVTSDSFMTWRNISSILREASVVGLLSIGVSFVIIGGGIDLSTGAVLGLAAMVTSRLVTDTLIPIWLIVLAALAIGAVCGLINGLMVIRLGLSELIATFATMYIYRGLVFILAYRENGRLITRSVQDEQFLSIGGKIGGIYIMSVIWLLIVILGYVILRKTVFGTYVYAIGTNRKSSTLSGINVDRIKVGTFVICGFCSALAGVFLLAWQGSAGLNSGSGMEFQAIAAVAVGGIVLSGGRGDTVGVCIGSLFMIIIVNGIYKFGLPTEIQTIAYGAVIIVMSIFDSLYIRITQKRHVVNKKAPALQGGESA